MTTPSELKIEKKYLISDAVKLVLEVTAVSTNLYMDVGQINLASLCISALTSAKSLINRVVGCRYLHTVLNLAGADFGARKVPTEGKFK